MAVQHEQTESGELTAPLDVRCSLRNLGEEFCHQPVAAPNNIFPP
jgi:hypothetical protein